jgi:hypothetical protein
MRRAEKEIITIDEKLKIIESCKFCRMGLCKKHLPMNMRNRSEGVMFIMIKRLQQENFRIKI